MKKIYISLFSFLALVVVSQESNTFRFGLQFGLHGNSSELSGGMENANARFYHNSFGGGSLRLEARYDFNQHWMLSTGLGFTSYGFEYALSENYSLKNVGARFSAIRSEFGAIEIPLMGFYKFNPNCRNSKWIVGAGFAHNLIGEQTISKKFKEDAEGIINNNCLNSDTRVNGGIYTMLRFSVGRERVYKKGGILNASMLFNFGNKNMATSEVVYTVDGQEYIHEFKNNGSFVGLRLTYFLKPRIKTDIKNHYQIKNAKNGFVK